MKETIISKGLDLLIDGFWHFTVYILKISSPIAINPKKISGNLSEWKDISDIKIENRLNKPLFDIHIYGISKQKFDLKIISDSGTGPKKTVTKMEINTDRLVIYANDQRNGNTVWIFRIHKLEPKQIIELKVKTDNADTIHLFVVRHSKIATPIKERSDGAIAIPFTIDEVPEI
jgi:hypothetical protein